MDGGILERGKRISGSDEAILSAEEDVVPNMTCLYVIIKIEKSSHSLI